MGCHSLLQGGLPLPGVEPGSPALQADSLPTRGCSLESVFLLPSNALCRRGSTWSRTHLLSSEMGAAGAPGPELTSCHQRWGGSPGLTQVMKQQGGGTTKSRTESPAATQGPALAVVFDERKTANFRPGLLSRHGSADCKWKMCF